MEFVKKYADKAFMVNAEEASSKADLMQNGKYHQTKRNANARRRQKQAQENPMWKPKTFETMPAVSKHENDAIHQERLFAAIGVLGFIAFLTFKDISQ